MDSRIFPVGSGVAIATLVLAAGAIPASAKPSEPSFIQIELQSGVIHCALGTPVAGTGDLCTISPVFPAGDESQLPFNIPEGANFSYVEMNWEATSAFGGKRLALTVPNEFGGDETHTVEGVPILATFVKSADENGAPPGTGIKVRASAPSDLSLILDQKFTVAVSSFVNTPFPDGYSAFE
jgi:hypothetical protein